MCILHTIQRMWMLFVGLMLCEIFGWVAVHSFVGRLVARALPISHFQFLHSIHFDSFGLPALYDFHSKLKHSGKFIGKSLKIGRQNQNVVYDASGGNSKEWKCSKITCIQSEKEKNHSFEFGLVCVFFFYAFSLETYNIIKNTKKIYFLVTIWINGKIHGHLCLRVRFFVFISMRTGELNGWARTSGKGERNEWKKTL